MTIAGILPLINLKVIQSTKTLISSVILFVVGACRFCTGLFFNEKNEGTRMVDMARREIIEAPGFLENGSEPALLFMAGFAGAGKTTLAQWLYNKLDWIVVDKDALQRSFLATGVEKELAGWNAFEELFGLIEKALTQGKSVIVDTSNEKPFIFERAINMLQHRRDGQQASLNYMILFCLASEQTRMQRLQKRGSTLSPYYEELPSILPDSELRNRLGHLLPLTELQALLGDPHLFKRFSSPLQKEHIVFIDTNQPLETYAGATLEIVKTFYSTIHRS